MNRKFDERARSLANSVVRRQPGGLSRFALALASTALAALPAIAQVSQLGPLIELSQPNPVPGCSDGLQIGTLTVNDAVEPCVAVNPADPNNIVAAWFLGRLQSVIAGVSFNGGQSWQQVPIPFTRCSSGPYLAAADERLAFGPSGDLYAFAVTINALSTRGISVSKSTDGGLHWSPLVDMTGSTYVPNDLPVVTADPVDADFVYAVWDGLDHRNQGAAVFSRTTDGGQTWEPARAIVLTRPQEYVQFSQILVLADGTLVDLFEIYAEQPRKPATQTSLQVLRSTDRGLTWSAPASAVTMTPLYGPNFFTLVVDPENGQFVQDPTNPSFAVDRQSGNLYAVWEDGRFSNFQYNDIAFSMSADGGATWSAPIRVNQTPLNIPAPNRQAFLPSIAVQANGTIGVSYYDFRFNDPNPGVPTDRWLAQCQPSPSLPPSSASSWGNEVRLRANSFNLEACKPGGRGYFVGDYLGLAAAGNAFVAVFTQPDPVNGISSIFARRVGH
jgi:hypothetical protein